MRSLPRLHQLATPRNHTTTSYDESLDCKKAPVNVTDLPASRGPGVDSALATPLGAGNFPGDKRNFDGTSWDAVPFRHGASYVIFIDANDSNKIKALNGAPGAIDYSGTEPALVIYNAINALTNGGRVLIRAGMRIFAA